MVEYIYKVKETEQTKQNEESKMTLEEIRKVVLKDKLVLGTSIYNSNLLIDLNTDERYEVYTFVDSKKLYDLCGDDYHITIGTNADFSEDKYEDLQEDIRDLYMVVIEPIERYKLRRAYGY